MPCSSTPAGSARQAIRRAAFAFRLNNDVGTHKVVYFGARSHGLQTRCLRFASRITPTTRKTRFRLVASLDRAGLITCGIPKKVSGVFYILPPSPGFPGAMLNKLSVFRTWAFGSPEGPRTFDRVFNTSRRTGSAPSWRTNVVPSGACSRLANLLFRKSQILQEAGA